MMISFSISYVAALHSEERQKFIEFVAKYGKSYASIDHHEERFQTFSENLRFINKHNSKNLGFRMGIN
jgi:hypothetical protein